MKCDSCGRASEEVFHLTKGGESYTFDSFACAIHHLSPLCECCSCRILVQPIESGGHTFCSARCLRRATRRVA